MNKINIYVRKIKTLIRLLKGVFVYEWVKRKYKLPRILSIEETIQKVVENNMSVARFGDSEFLYLRGGFDGLQKKSSQLQEGLKRTLINHHDHLMLCLVDYEDLTDRTWRARLSAKMFYSQNIKHYINYLDPGREYGNSNMTRFYMGNIHKQRAGKYFQQLSKIWDKKNIVIFEGLNTRFGYKNELLSNAASIKRVLCPSKQAFDYYDLILEKAKSFPKDTLLFFALGASATVAAGDLTKLGYQVIDIGNLDVEYDWYKLGAKKVVKLPYKQVSEVTGGGQVLQVEEEGFLNQVLFRIPADLN